MSTYIKFEKKSGYNQDEIWLNGHERVFQHQMMIPMLSKLEILQSFQQLTKVITNQFMSQKQAQLHPLVGYFLKKREKYLHKPHKKLGKITIDFGL